MTPIEGQIAACRRRQTREKPSDEGTTRLGSARGAPAGSRESVEIAYERVEMRIDMVTNMTAYGIVFTYLSNHRSISATYCSFDSSAAYQCGSCGSITRRAVPPLPRIAS